MLGEPEPYKAKTAVEDGVPEMLNTKCLVDPQNKSRK